MSYSIPKQTNRLLTSSVHRFMVKAAVLAELLLISIRKFRNPIKSAKAVRHLLFKYREFLGQDLMGKVAKVDGRYYWRFASPGFPSLASSRLRENEFNREFLFPDGRALSVLLLGITKKCGLSCEHCYEWDRMHGKEVLSVHDLKRIVLKYQDFGTTLMMFGGGEPLLRLQDIGAVLDVAKKGTDFWIVTSGWKLDRSKAKFLKEKGLTGVMVSLDSHVAAQHDMFRGSEGIYEMALNAVVESNRAGLVTGLSLCPTKEYTTDENLRSYMELARELGVTFVQIFEPRAAGRYDGMDVALSPTQIRILEEIYLTYNTSGNFRDYPIIMYGSYYQRRMGCLGAGEYYMYIDTNGDAHSCPFCSAAVCDAKSLEPADAVSILREHGHCHLESAD